MSDNADNRPPPPRKKLDQWGVGLHLQGIEACRRKKSEKLRGQKFGKASPGRVLTDAEQREIEKRLCQEGAL